MTKENYDFINPTHYKKGNKEVWEMMVDIWGIDAFIAHCEMNAFKYRMRAGDKPNQPIDRDIDKAHWYEGKAAELRAIEPDTINQGGYANPHTPSEVTISPVTVKDDYVIPTSKVGMLKIGDWYESSYNGHKKSVFYVLKELKDTFIVCGFINYNDAEEWISDYPIIKSVWLVFGGNGIPDTRKLTDKEITDVFIKKFEAHYDGCRHYRLTLDEYEFPLFEGTNMSAHLGDDENWFELMRKGVWVR